MLFLLLFKKTNLSVNGIRKAHWITQNENYFFYSGKNVHSQGISERISWWSKERDNPCPGNMITLPVLVFSSLKLLIIKWVATLHFGEGSGTPSSTLAWKIPWMEEPGRLQSMGSLGVGHDWVTSLSLLTFTHWRRKWQPTPVFLPGESQGQWGLVGCRLWGRTESDTTEAT